MFYNVTAKLFHPPSLLILYERSGVTLENNHDHSGVWLKYIEFCGVELTNPTK